MSVLGPHCILSSPEALTFAKVAPCVKSVDNLDILKAARPDALRIFRHYFPTQNFDDPHGAVNAILSSLAGYRHPLLYVETYNEIPKGSLAFYIPFLQIAVPLLHAAGVKVAGPSWSTGDYEQGDWSAFRLAHWAGLDLIDLHAYWGTQGFSQWHALRYRTYWRPGDPNIVISECGRDKIEGGKGGWVLDWLSPEQYAHELTDYATETAKDAYVAGVTPFTWGPTPDWQNFTGDPVTGILLQLLGYPQPPSKPGGSMISDAELQRLVSDCFTRANVPDNPTSAFVKYFTAQLRAGHYLGAPEEPEHESEDKTLLLQRFASAYLWCRKADFAVHESALPFGP